MAQEVYSGYPASFAYGVGGASTLSLSQLSGVDKSTGKALLEVVAGGDLDRKAVILSHADPRVSLQTADLTSILGVLSASVGLSITGAATFFMQQRASGGTFTGAGANVKVTNATGGFLALNSLSARQDDSNDGCLAELMYWPHSSDGLTAPLTYSEDEDLAGTPAFGSQFFLGPAYIGATQLEGLLASEVQFGIDYQLIRSSGNPYATAGYIIRRRPIIRLTFDKITNITSAALFTTSFAASDLVVYFWKGAHGGSRVAKATTEHAKITATAGEWGADSVSWSRDESGNVVITAMPTDALTMAVNSALP